VLDESVGTTDVSKLSEADLGDDGSKFTGSSRDTMCGGTVTSGEDLSRDDEGGGVGAEVLEEIGEAVEEDEGLGSTMGGDKFVVPETHADEGTGKDDETHHLDWLASPTVDESEGDPVSRDETSNGKNQVTDADIPQVVKDLV